MPKKMILIWNLDRSGKESKLDPFKALIDEWLKQDL
jgi:hypothetical protein